MIRTTLPTKDTTIYESNNYTYQNAGLDQVLDLGKEISGTGSYNSRVLIKFDITSISASVADGTISGGQYFLNLKTTDAEALPSEFSVETFPLSQNWSNGIGRRYDNEINTTGSNWIYRTETLKWATGSYAALETGSWSSNNGGGNWFTSSVASQSFEIGSTDLRVNISDIVTAWINGDYTNNGLIVKLSDTDEQSLDSIGKLKYFSIDSNTIHVPTLTAEWNDSTFSVTGSTLPDSDAILYIPRLKRNYKQGSIAKIVVKSRPQHPVRTFATSSNYLDTYILPTQSFFQVKDAYSEEVIYETGSATQLSNDGSVNFFNFDTSGLMPERHYRFIFKSTFETGEIEFFDNRFYFKVTR